MKIENRQRVLAIFAITAVVLLASDRLILTPLTRAWKARAGRIAELKREVTQGGMLLERERVIPPLGEARRRLQTEGPEAS